MTTTTAEHSILNEYTNPKSRENLMVGDHIYAIPTFKFATGLPWQVLQSRATHVFRITPSEVICENHGERASLRKPHSASGL